MRLSLLLAAVALLACMAAATASPSLSSIDSDLAFLEQAATRSESASSVLKSAEKYAESKVSAALARSKQLLADAAAAGRKEADSLGPAPVKHVSNAAKLAHKAERKAERAAAKEVKLAAKAAAKAEAKAEAKAKKEEKKLAEVEKAQAKAIEQEAAKKAAAIVAARKAKRQALGFKGGKLRANKEGVFGAVSFGIPKIDSTPVPLAKKATGSALERFSKHGPKKNIYGRRKSCLKDIAAHFDEKDIYESKKLALLQQMSTTRSLAHAQSLRSKLANLETWHQLMQKKFLMSAAEQKTHQRRVERLFDEYLPQELKDQLAQNKVAKRAAQPLPFPEAQKQAFKILRQKRTQIQKMERMKSHGHKRWVRPEINDKGFPSMDPISTMNREKLWRNVETQQEWSVDRREFEKAENIVTAAHKAHGDFVEGPIAAPILKGKLYHPDTERLGVPNFLTKFPWPKEPEEKVSMDDKQKVEQTYHQTW